MPSSSMLGLQDASSHVMLESILFHDMVMVILIFISIAVGGALQSSTYNPFMSTVFLEGQMLEWVWTLVPGIILIFIVLPSISLMYLYDELMNFEFSIKCVGHQWFWSYEYAPMGGTSHKSVEFDSYMKQSSDLRPEEFRLLDTDTSMFIPAWTMIQLLISSEDVLHAWAMPSLGVKIDAVPGRINNLLFNCSQPGVFYGQCSEICGAYHSFMPIKMEVLSPMDFLKWLVS